MRDQPHAQSTFEEIISISVVKKNDDNEFAESPAYTYACHQHNFQTIDQQFGLTREKSAQDA